MNAKSYDIAVLPGDGIGAEVTAEAVKVLQAVAPRLAGVSFELHEHAVGAAEYQRNGDPLPPLAYAACQSADAILLGAMGLPAVRWPDGRELAPQLDLRERLELYAGLRPIKLYNHADSRLRLPADAVVDFMLVRESTEGLFSSRLQNVPADASVVEDRLRVTRHGSERLFHAAFQQARRRRRRVTLIDKANVLPSMVFMRKIFFEIAEQYPDVTADTVYVDAAALYLVQRPQSFDVMVTENMFGDILSDLAAGIVGGMGMAPSADLGDRHAVFQPSHGSAPDIAGKGVANPTATILSLVMMLDWLAHPETVRAARAIEQAVSDVLADASARTPDMGGTLRTHELGDAITARARTLIEEVKA